MPKGQNAIRAPKTHQKTFDTGFEKKPRGRPQTIPPSTVIGRAENYRSNLTYVWTKLGEPLAKAQTKDDVIATLKDHGGPCAHDLVRLASEILTVVRDRHFPRRPKARLGFLADSLAGMPTITARSSRDICVKERARERARQQAISPHKIIRKEFYIECECGYRGPALADACRTCGATIPQSLGVIWGNPGSF